MIVRISGEGQFTLADEDAAHLNDLERDVKATVESGRKQDFPAAFGALLAYVRERGDPLPDDSLEGSQVILPPSDATFEESGREFTGEGLIPD
jgi:hypothetical protein